MGCRAGAQAGERCLLRRLAIRERNRVGLDRLVGGRKLGRRWRKRGVDVRVERRVRPLR
jgi:hypothetical protein